MGLTIHYSLTTPGDEAQARNIITSLHQAAHDLPFATVGDIVDLSGADCRFDRRKPDDPLLWMLCQAQGSARLRGPRRVGRGQTGDLCVDVNPNRVIAFTAWPGEGCEDSNFGLCQYPQEIYTPSLGTVETNLAGWRWHSFCKTQYASNPAYGGIVNFLRCHLVVIALLDRAKELGCLEQVSDEGGFWRSRDMAALVKTIGSWNQMVAALGGTLKDMLGDGVQMPISEYPDFERLETAGQRELPPEMATLVRLMHRVIKEPVRK